MRAKQEWILPRRFSDGFCFVSHMPGAMGFGSHSFCILSLSHCEVMRSVVAISSWLLALRPLFLDLTRWFSSMPLSNRNGSAGWYPNEI